MSIFSGTPITAATSSQSTTQTPSWLQNAIYNQIQTAQAASQLPFQTYTGQLNAGPTGNQQAAWQSGLSALQNPQSVQTAANPYLQAAGQSSTSNISSYMNPYNQQVTDRIAQLGVRNLSENLLPAVGDQFVRAGQFGGSRMGEFASRALRDTQEAVLGQQADALQSGYNTALSTAQGDLGRQLQLGQLAGNLAQQDLSGLQSIRQELAGYGDTEREQQQQGLEALYNQYLRSQAYPQQQTNFLTQQLQGLSPLVTSISRQAGVEPTGNFNPSTLSQILGSISGLQGILGGGSSGGSSGGGLLGGLSSLIGGLFGGGSQGDGLNLPGLDHVIG